MRLHEPIFLLIQYMTGLGSLVIPCIALGLLCACPFIARRIIDHV